jgi:hypothetical protein
MTIEGIASPSTTANPISNRGLIILSAAPCSYDASNHPPVADTLPPSAATAQTLSFCSLTGV